MARDYNDSVAVQKLGEEMLAPFFDLESDRKWMLIQNSPHAVKLQKECGDVFLTLPSGHMSTVEIKAERKYTGNLVFEDWSNATFITDPERYLRGEFKFGWGPTIRAEVLAFAFLDRRLVTFCRTTDFLRFVYSPETYRHVIGPRTPQGVKQSNHTLFRCVPIARFKEHFPLHAYHVDQGELFAEDLRAIHKLVDEDQVAWRRP